MGTDDRRSPTPSRELTAFLEERRRGLGAALGKRAAIPRRDGRGEAPLSFAQSRVWFYEQLSPGGGAYNRPANFRLVGRLNVETLSRSLDAIIERHEALRATFHARDDGPIQIISPRLSLSPLPLIDLRHAPAATREERARHIAREEARRPFDLSRGPVVRASLLCLDEREHLLLLTFHHIAFDGWSQGVLLREFAAHYDAFDAGAQPALPEPPVEYGDFAVWQRLRLAGEDGERQLEYWRRKLANAPPPRELLPAPCDPGGRAARGAEYVVLVPPSLAHRLASLCRGGGATMFMALLATFYVLLHRYTGEDDLIIGAPVAGRTREEVEPLIGCFINTLALRTDLSGDPSFRELLRRVRASTLEAYTHQEVPYERIVEELGPDRRASPTPFFRVMLNLRNLPRAEAHAERIEIQKVESETFAAVEDLTLDVGESGGGLRCVFQYNSEQFDAESIARMGVHFMKLLEGIVTHPDEHISSLPMLTEAEGRQEIIEWNRTAVKFRGPGLLHKLFEEQAARAPDCVAVVFESECLTYGELNRRAEGLALRLRASGVGTDVPVGLFFEPSLEMVIAALGVLKAGGACLPLDPAHPPDRIAFMIEDASVAVILTKEQWRDQLPPADGRELIALDSARDMLASRAAENPPPEASSVDLAYILYTSGTTGTPKGVMLTHRGLCNHILWERDRFPTSPEDRVLHAAPVGFDTSVWEQFTALANGARLVVARAGAYCDAGYLVRLVADRQVTVIGLAPSVLHALLDADEGGGLRSLRRAFVGGEALTPDLREQFFSRLDGAALQNGYGPTECSIDTTFWECARDSRAAAVPIGRPVSNARVYVLDRNLQPVPAGVAGELHIGGAGVARGYLNRPDLTAESFIHDPFSHEPGARLYRTGDRARRLPDGNIEFLGRVDHQIKLRGVRIEPGEVESALERHPAVRGAAVVASVAQGGQFLSAYFVPLAGQAPPTGGELRDFLRRSLPECLLPSVFIRLGSLPLTPAGKLDRSALPPPREALARARGEEDLPRNQIERTIAGVWAEVLGVEYVGRDDNFFDLGGHSLLATRVVSRLRKVFQIELPLRSLFQSSDLVALAEIIAMSKPGGAETTPIAPLPREADQV
jgi:amino acid adenylation domain-containing protein